VCDDLNSTGDVDADRELRGRQRDRHRTFTNTLQPKLTINKVCEPTTDPGLFNLRSDGVTKTADAACGTGTGAFVVSIGQHTVSETAGTGTVLANYTSVIGGDCAADGTVTLAAGDNKTARSPIRDFLDHRVGLQPEHEPAPSIDRDHRHCRQDVTGRRRPR
jgi:hypothetical protein